MTEQNPNPPATVPAQREAVGPVKKSTPVIIALVVTREARNLKSIPANARDLSIHTTAPTVQQQKAPEREKTPQQERGQKPLQREIQRGYGIGLSL